MTNVVRKIGGQFGDGLAPIGSRLLTDQFYVEERALAWSKQMSAGRPTNDTWRHVCHRILIGQEIAVLKMLPPLISTQRQQENRKAALPMSKGKEQSG